MAKNQNIMGILEQLAVRITPLFNGQELAIGYFENELGTGGSSYYIPPHYYISLGSVEDLKVSFPFLPQRKADILKIFDPKYFKDKNSVPVRVLAQPVIIELVESALREIVSAYRQRRKEIGFAIDLVEEGSA